MLTRRHAEPERSVNVANTRAHPRGAAGAGRLLRVRQRQAARSVAGIPGRAGAGQPDDLRGRPHPAPSDRRRALRPSRRPTRAHPSVAARGGAGHRARRRRRASGAGDSTTGSTRSPSSEPSTRSALARPRVRLFFLGMRHPKPDIVESPVARRREPSPATGSDRDARVLQRGLGALRRPSELPDGGRHRREPPPRAPRDHVLVPHPHPRLPVDRAAHRRHRRRRVRASIIATRTRRRGPRRGRRRRGRCAGGRC